MGRYDSYDDFDELDLRRLRRGSDRPHSGMGAAAFVMGVVALVGVACSVIVIVALDAAQQGMGPDDDLWAALVLLVLLGCGTMSLAGLVLGLVGSFQSDRNPLFGILGTVVNAATIVGLAAVICLGIVSEL